MLFDQLVESVTGSDNRVICIRGPYWLPDEDPDADEHFGYDCLLNGDKFVVGEEPADKFLYIYSIDKGMYHTHVKNKPIMPLVKKAIEDYELKKKMKKAGLSDEQSDTAVKI